MSDPPHLPGELLEAVPSFTMLCSFRRGANECCIHGLGHRPGRKKKNDLAIDVGINVGNHEMVSFSLLVVDYLTLGRLGKQKLVGNSAVFFGGSL